jgi:hypothetical protein
MLFLPKTKRYTAARPFRNIGQRTISNQALATLISPSFQTMSSETYKPTRKVSDAAKKMKVDTNPSEPSLSSAPTQVISNTGDVDAHDGDGDPDNKSALSTGTYIITNVGRKMRAALCSSNHLAGVVASLDGTNLTKEAGEEVCNQA